MSAKVCAHCHQDCSNKPRVKDPGGQYYCKECYPVAQAAAKSAGVGASDGATFGVFDEPIIPTADIVAPKEDAKQTQKRTQEKNAELPPKNCQNCGIQMPATGIVCTNCGFNTTSGKALKTKIEKAKAAPKAAGGGATFTGNYASLWQRIVAAVVDIIVSIVIGVAVSFVCFAAFVDLEAFNASAASGEPSGEALAVYFAVTASVWLYYTLMESSAAQATIGKKLMGISMGTTSGGEVGFLRSSARYWLRTILYSVPGLNLLIWIVNMVLVIVTPRKQTIYDMATGVVVCQ